MVTIAEARQQTSMARKSLESEKSVVSKGKKQAEIQRIKLVEKEKAIPMPSQSKLRSGLYAGLEGRKRRQVVSKIKKEIGTGKQRLKKFEEGLIKYEKEQLIPFESELKKAESELREADIQESKYEKAKAVLDKGGLGYKELDSEERKIYERLSLGEAGLKSSTYLLSKGIKPVYSGEKLTGYESSKLGISFAPQYLPEILTTKKISGNNLKGLSRTDIVKDIKPINSILTGMSIKEPTFRTTGSPIRMTKLSSLKSRGYIPDRKPIKSSSFKKPIKTNNLFSNNKKDYSSKSNNSIKKSKIRWL